MSPSKPESGPHQPEDLGLSEFEADADDQGISLEDLGKTFAEMVASGNDPFCEAPEPQEAVEAPPAWSKARSHDDACEITPRSILEAMLFLGHPDNESLSSREVAALMRGVPPREIDELVKELNEFYAAENCPYEIVSQGAGYRLQLRPEFNSLRARFFGRVKAARLSQAAIDVLAIVAYSQPITREEIDRLRGRPSGGLLSQLVRRQLLHIHRDEQQPRLRRYRTTERFLELFSLGDVSELPKSHELDREL